MPSEKEIYNAHADQYERLILREDYQSNIPAEINKIMGIRGIDIIEFGAGTGRLTRSLAKNAAFIAASDLSHHMLLTAKTVLGVKGFTNTSLSVADMRCTPYQAHSADMVIAGWSFCYLAVWEKEKWEEELQLGLTEAGRLLRPGGVLIILENYGTGFEKPNPPSHLNNYYNFLTSTGFQSTWFRTDYLFKDLAEAIELSDFFFGEELSLKVAESKTARLPECTGVFWKEF